jgi:spoIIIJ-associated protein
MIYEFEGKTEKEAIDKAAAELSLERDRFDVEILEVRKGGIFKSGLVRIRVHTDGGDAGTAQNVSAHRHKSAPLPERETEHGESLGSKDFAALEKKISEFLKGVISRMGYDANVVTINRGRDKLTLRIDSDSAADLIGKKGKTIDALQLITTVFAAANGARFLKVILDCEDYRLHHEEDLVQLAYAAADRVRESRGSVLLEPMNPFDRRIVHTTLNDAADVSTESEGQGIFKQVRVFFKR